MTVVVASEMCNFKCMHRNNFAVARNVHYVFKMKTENKNADGEVIYYISGGRCW